MPLKLIPDVGVSHESHGRGEAVAVESEDGAIEGKDLGGHWGLVLPVFLGCGGRAGEGIELLFLEVYKLLFTVHFYDEGNYEDNEGGACDPSSFSWDLKGDVWVMMMSKVCKRDVQSMCEYVMQRTCASCKLPQVVCGIMNKIDRPSHIFVFD
jgi:hypothetical protein